MKQHIIYGLIDPNTHELRYIGYTSNQIRRYNRHHCASDLKSKTYKNNWIKSLLAKDQKAEMYIIEKYETAEKLPQAEIGLIEYYKSIGCNLTNATKGGDGGYHQMSEETKIKIGLASKGRKYSDEHKKKLSLSMKGHFMSEEREKEKYLNL
jgi:predicted GIY-YIG superfamily endonuclease